MLLTYIGTIIIAKTHCISCCIKTYNRASDTDILASDSLAAYWQYENEI